MKMLRSKMRLSERALSWRSLAPALLFCCLLFLTIYFINSPSPLSSLSFEPSVRLSLPMRVMNDEDGGTVQSGGNKVSSNASGSSIVPASTESAASGELHLLRNFSGSESLSNSTLFCDTSHERFDTCFLRGDVRIISNASKLFFLSSSSSTKPSNNTWKIRPYARKWEAPVIARIKELSIDTIDPPRSETSSLLCSTNHTTPALIFSTGGFSGNFFHDLTDILIPLYVTSHHFGGEVRFLVSDFNPKFVAKYQPLLARLSRRELINLDRDDNIHCFSEVHIGLVNNQELGIDTSKPPPGSTMAGFRNLLRSSFSLKRNKFQRKGTRKPRLMIQLRKGSRELLNSREVISMSRKLGFKVVVAGTEETKNITSYSAAVNTVDALLGVHGAGLANIVFLPEGAAVIQIIPWGELKWACRFSYGDPAIGMGLQYFEYEIKEEESSLIELYPRNHTVFTNPAAIHKQGWNMIWSVFLDKQKVRVDVKRLKVVLTQVLRNLN